MKVRESILILVLLISFYSCQKCQSCNTLIESEANQTISSTTDEYCGDNYDDAPTETSYSQTVGGQTESVTISCVEE
jgi:hypothetical protein